MLTKSEGLVAQSYLNRLGWVKSQTFSQTIVSVTSIIRSKLETLEYYDKKVKFFQFNKLNINKT